MRYQVTVDGRVYDVEVDGSRVGIDGAWMEVELTEREGTPLLRLVVDGRAHQVWGERFGRGEWTVQVDGEPRRVEVLDENAARARAMGGSAADSGGPRPMRAPMPGLVLRVDVEEGQEITSGQGLLIVEAMKMENELRAAGPGRVSKIHVAAGNTVEKDDVLIEFFGEGDGGDGGVPAERVPGP